MREPWHSCHSFQACYRCRAARVDRRAASCSFCPRIKRADALTNLPILAEVASAKAEMWPLRQPNGDATRELCSRWQKNSGTK